MLLYDDAAETLLILRSGRGRWQMTEYATLTAVIYNIYPLVRIGVLVVSTI